MVIFFFKNANFGDFFQNLIFFSPQTLSNLTFSSSWAHFHQIMMIPSKIWTKVMHFLFHWCHTLNKWKFVEKALVSRGRPRILIASLEMSSFQVSATTLILVTKAVRVRLQAWRNHLRGMSNGMTILEHVCPYVSHVQFWLNSSFWGIWAIILLHVHFTKQTYVL
jgi:hypothetical protein